MDNNLKPDKQLIAKPIKEEIESIKNQFKNLSLESRFDKCIKDYLVLRDTPNRSKKQEKEFGEIQNKMAYMAALDFGTLLQMIPKKEEQVYGIYDIRQRLIKENNCKSAMELILVDQIAAAYWRLMRYELYAYRLPSTENEGWSFDQLKVNILKETRKQIEQAQRQIDLCMVQLMNLKQPQLKVHVKTDNAYFAQNQQVINEKPKEVPPVETIKP